MDEIKLDVSLVFYCELSATKDDLVEALNVDPDYVYVLDPPRLRPRKTMDEVNVYIMYSPLGRGVHSLAKHVDMLVSLVSELNATKLSRVASLGMRLSVGLFTENRFGSLSLDNGALRRITELLPDADIDLCFYGSVDGYFDS